MDEIAFGGFRTVEIPVTFGCDGCEDTCSVTRVIVTHVSDRSPQGVEHGEEDSRIQLYGSGCVDLSMVRYHGSRLAVG